MLYCKLHTHDYLKLLTSNWLRNHIYFPGSHSSSQSLLISLNHLKLRNWIEIVSKFIDKLEASEVEKMLSKIEKSIIFFILNKCGPKVYLELGKLPASETKIIIITFPIPFIFDWYLNRHFVATKQACIYGIDEKAICKFRFSFPFSRHTECRKSPSFDFAGRHFVGELFCCKNNCEKKEVAKKYKTKGHQSGEIKKQKVAEIWALWTQYKKKKKWFYVVTFRSSHKIDKMMVTKYLKGYYWGEKRRMIQLFRFHECLVTEMIEELKRIL